MPDAFLPGQGGGYHPPAVQPSPPEPPATRRNSNAPYVNAPVLSISKKGPFCTFSKSLMRAANAGPGHRVRVVPPPYAGQAWHLDTCPRPGEGVAVGPTGFFRLPPISPKHFRRPAPSYQPGTNIIVGNRNEPVELLRFVLGPEVEGQPGYFELRPEL